ncbi:MAG: hypothetical protein IPN76_34470 [Saprospiraceae bacterium]|nr:hypothetical protein [Saprospiraceae bacterium]
MKTIKLAALLPLFLLSATLWISCTDDDLVADPRRRKAQYPTPSCCFPVTQPTRHFHPLRTRTS